MGGGLLVSLTRAWWKRVSFWALMLGSSIASMRSKRSSSCLLSTLMVLQQPSLHGVGSSGPLEVLVLEIFKLLELDHSDSESYSSASDSELRQIYR